MQNLKEQSIGQIVAADYRAAKVFQDYNIDFCCGGEKNIEDVCSNSGVDEDEVVAALENISEEGVREDHYDHWSLDFLVDYIIHNHHAFIREKLPEINFYSEKVARVHGDVHEELIDMYKEFCKLSEEVMDHMQKEEKQLFPYIKKMTASRRGEGDDETEHSAKMIAMMREEHDETGDALKKLRQLSRNYTLPNDACSTYRVYFENLQGFEQDMHKHVHLENNILFPKVLKQI